jgi:hypothetical protein
MSPTHLPLLVAIILEVFIPLPVEPLGPDFLQGLAHHDKGPEFAFNGPLKVFEVGLFLNGKLDREIGFQLSLLLSEKIYGPKGLTGRSLVGWISQAVYKSPRGDKLVAIWEPAISLCAHLSFRKAPPTAQIFAYKIFGPVPPQGEFFYRE